MIGGPTRLPTALPDGGGEGSAARNHPDVVANAGGVGRASLPLPNQPTLPETKEWLRLRDPIDDVALAEGLAAAVDHQTRYLVFPVDFATLQRYYPDGLRQAAMLRAGRYLARRSSPEGVVGFGEYGPVTIAAADRDIRELEAPADKPVTA